MVPLLIDRRFETGALVALALLLLAIVIVIGPPLLSLFR